MVNDTQVGRGLQVFGQNCAAFIETKDSQQDRRKVRWAKDRVVTRESKVLHDFQDECR